jgi:hypothetical protein
MPLKSDSETSVDDQPDSEQDMRRALGLDRGHPQRGWPTQQPFDRQKRRFVRDGEVPVVLLNAHRDQTMHGGDFHVAPGTPLSNRIMIAESAAKAEREARELAERRLIEAQAMLRDMQTKLGHTALALDETRAALQRVRDEKQAAEAALAVEREAAEKAMKRMITELRAYEDRVREMAFAGQSKPIAAKAEKSSVKPAKAKSAAKATPRPRSTGPKPKPVKWWIRAG